MSKKNTCLLKNKGNLLLELYFFIFAIRWLTNINFVAMFFIWSFVGLIIFCYTFEKYQQIFEIVFITLILFFFALLSQFISNSNSIAAPISLFVETSLGLLLWGQRKKLQKISTFCILIITYLSIRAALLVKTVGKLEEGTVSLTKLTGQNTVSIIIIFCISVYIIDHIQSNKKISLYPFFIAFAGCIFCEGTGGILVSSLLLIGMLIKKNKKNNLSYLKLSLLIIVIAIVTIYKIDVLIKIFKRLSDSNSRVWIWTNYFKLSLKSFNNLLFGAPVESISFLYDQKNMHNTYINFHYRCGLITFIFFIFCITKIFIYYLKTKNYLMLVVLGCISLRAFTDEASFCYVPLWIYMWLESLFGQKHFQRVVYKNIIFKFNKGEE